MDERLVKSLQPKNAQNILRRVHRKITEAPFNLKTSQHFPLKMENKTHKFPACQNEIHTNPNQRRQRLSEQVR